MHHEVTPVVNAGQSLSDAHGIERASPSRQGWPTTD